MKTKFLSAIWQLIKDILRFFADASRYFRAALIFHLVVLLGLVPTLVALTDYLLNRKDIDYLSYDNILSIFSQYPLTGLALVFIVLFILLLVFVEFNFLTLLIYFVKQKVRITLRQLLFLSFLQIRRIRPLSFLFFVLYFALVLPLSNIGGRLDILSNIKIPNFVLVYVLTGPKLLLAAFIIVSLASLYLAWRTIFALPLIFLNKLSLCQALSRSWTLSKHHFLNFIVQVAVLTGVLNGLFWFVMTQLTDLQRGIDAKVPGLSLAAAVLIMLIIQGLALSRIVLSLVLIFYLIISFLKEDGELTVAALEVPQNKWLLPTKKLHTGLFSTALVLLAVFLTGLSNLNYLRTDPLAVHPLIISHRGVSGGNGVQNTISALEATHKTYQPDYVEMDIRQTADKQFVVMHGSNLKALTSVNKMVSQMTLTELTELTVRENGKSAPLVSFDNYLKAADKLHQKLLIEIKADKSDNIQQITTNFYKRYAADILKQGDRIHTLNFQVADSPELSSLSKPKRIHTLNFQVADSLKTMNPRLNVAYIIVYNLLGLPDTHANAFSVETSNLSASFVSKAHREDREVYAWDVDDEDTIHRMRLYQVDGLITDNIALVKETLAANNQQMTCEQKLRLYLLNYDNRQWGDLLFGNLDKNAYQV